MRARLVLGGVVALLLVAVMAIGVIGSGAYFSDTETSNGNQFTAATLNLTLNDTPDGQNRVQYTVDMMKPRDQINPEGWGSFELHNTGTVAGFVDIHSISLQALENGITEPEAEAGDTSADVGELQNVLNLRLWVDADGNGWMGDATVEPVLFNGRLKDLPSDLNANIPIPAGATVKLGVLFDWWSAPVGDTVTDNVAQGDTCVLDLTFELGQEAAQ